MLEDIKKELIIKKDYSIYIFLACKISKLCDGMNNELEIRTIRNKVFNLFHIPSSLHYNILKEMEQLNYIEIINRLKIRVVQFDLKNKLKSTDEILMLSSSHTHKEIAEKLGIERSTVTYHLNKLNIL